MRKATTSRYMYCQERLPRRFQVHTNVVQRRHVHCAAENRSFRLSSATGQTHNLGGMYTTLASSCQISVRDRFKIAFLKAKNTVQVHNHMMIQLVVNSCQLVVTSCQPRVLARSTRNRRSRGRGSIQVCDGVVV
jgi:hypothetical protein